jgi:ubiquinone/menaquinone biosynthesis C-methylase UbiE
MYAIFDHHLLTKHRNRAANMPPNGADFLWQECADRLIDKLSDIQRRFPKVLDLGCHQGQLKTRLQHRFGIETIIACDASSHMLNAAEFPKLIADPEWLPFAPESFDLVLSIGTLHWVNDVPGCLAQIVRILKPDGLFIGMLAGGESLIELRASMHDAMEKTTGGISPRLSPMMDIPDAGSLLQRAGFALPVVDREQIIIDYSHPIKLMHDLRAMGQTNALLHRSNKMLRRSTMTHACNYYLDHFPASGGEVTATFDLLTLTGWKS